MGNISQRKNYGRLTMVGTKRAKCNVML